MGHQMSRFKLSYICLLIVVIGALSQTAYTIAPLQLKTLAQNFVFGFLEVPYNQAVQSKPFTVKLDTGHLNRLNNGGFDSLTELEHWDEASTLGWDIDTERCIEGACAKLTTTTSAEAGELRQTVTHSTDKLGMSIFVTAYIYRDSSDEGEYEFCVDNTCKAIDVFGWYPYEIQSPVELTNEVYIRPSDGTYSNGNQVDISVDAVSTSYRSVGYTVSSQDMSVVVKDGAGAQTISNGNGEVVSLANTRINSDSWTQTANKVWIRRDGIFLVSGHIGFQSGASSTRARCVIRKNGSSFLIDHKGTPNNQGSGGVSCPAKAVELSNGDYLEIVFYNDTGTSQAIDTSTATTYLSVVEITDTASVLKAIDPVICQEKDLTQLTNDGTAATFNSLTVDRCYTVHLQTYYSGVQSGEQINCIFRDTGDTKRVTETRVYGVVDGSSTIAINSSVGASKQFPAVGSSYEVVCDFLDGTSTNGTLVGGAGNGRSYVQLCEMPANYICNSNKFD